MTQTAQKARRVLRPPGVKVINISLPVAAAELLARFAASRKAHGHFLAQLLFCEEARREERARLLADQ